MAASKKGKRRRKIIIFILIGVVLAGLTVMAVFNKKEVGISVQTEKVGRRDLVELVIATGKIHPVKQVVINPEVSGEIVDLPVREGQKVKVGDILLRIRPDNYIASTNSSDASYRSALANQNLSAANLEKAQLEFERARQLSEAQLISESQFLEAKTTLAVGEASYETSTHQVDQARAALDRSIEELSRTVITSPMAGTVTQLKAEQGQRVVGTAMMAGTEIMTIADLSAMEARVEVGEIDVVLIEAKQKVRVQVDAYRDKEFEGEVSEIANAANTYGAGQQQEATRFQVKIRILDREPFRPGMSVTTEIETRSRTNVLAVPIQCVTTRMPKTEKNESESSNGGDEVAIEEKVEEPEAESETEADEEKDPVEVVFVIENEKARMIPVKRGIADDHYVEIEEGLEEGLEVVTGSYRAINNELEDGKLVIVEPARNKGKADEGT
jgi:HlyD family secretion protein